MKIYNFIKIYNNKKSPHLLNFPTYCYGKIYNGKYYLKIKNIVLEIGWNVL